LLLYIALINPIYVSSIQDAGRANPNWLDTLTETRMLQHIDSLRLVRHISQGMYRMNGWAFPEDSDVPLDQFQKRIILTNDEGDIYLFDALNITRTDVDEHFSYPNRDVQDAGFYVLISKYTLPRGKYQVGIIYTDPSTETEYTRTQFYVERTPNTLVMYKDQPSPHVPVFDRLALKAKSALKQVLLAIDSSGGLLAQVRQVFIGEGESE
jgi:hypothetical protein